MWNIDWQKGQQKFWVRTLKHDSYIDLRMATNKGIVLIEKSIIFKCIITSQFK